MLATMGRITRYGAILTVTENPYSLVEILEDSLIEGPFFLCFDRITSKPGKEISGQLTSRFVFAPQRGQYFDLLETQA